MSEFCRKLSGFLSLFCFVFILVLLSGRMAQAADRIQKTGNPIVIVIDPGHGGENDGTTENGFLEKQMNMTTALAMYEELSKFDQVEVFLTHTEDVDLSLKERAVFASEKNADFIISIHYNASESHLFFGSEVWISLDPDFHAQGYQLATMLMREFRDLGMDLRGIKTKRHSNGKDYYGLIRESVSRGVPALIVEHCHVDHPLDCQHCDSEEELIAFGQADARAVAKYFGLRSESLGIDYSQEASSLPEVKAGELISRALYDNTPPEYCRVSLIEARYDEDLVTVEIQANDPDSNLIYYHVSLDNGQTYGDRIPWPEGDILTGSFTGTFTTVLEIPDGTNPQICVRAYNPYDLCLESEPLTFPQIFRKPVPVTGEAETVFEDGTGDLLPASEEEKESDKIGSILRILEILIVILAVLFILLLCGYGYYGKRKKHGTHPGRKSGNNRDIP